MPYRAHYSPQAGPEISKSTYSFVWLYLAAPTIRSLFQRNSFTILTENTRKLANSNTRNGNATISLLYFSRRSSEGVNSYFLILPKVTSQDGRSKRQSRWCTHGLLDLIDHSDIPVVFK